MFRLNSRSYKSVLNVVSIATLLSFSLLLSATERALEEVVVTAQKREQSLNDVPISVVAISGEEISKGNIENLEDLSAKLPAITVTEAAAGDQIFIRGIGSGINSGFEQSVGTFIDGVYFGRGRQSVSQFLDIDHVEVLKGPQSTYFGNNTIGGAINILARKPGTKWEGYVNALYEVEHDEYDLQIAGGGPVNDVLGVRIAGRYRNIDGWLKNTFNGNSAPKKESYALRGSLLYTPTPELEIYAKVEGSNLDEEGNGFQIVHCPPVPGFAGPGPACAAHLTVTGFEDVFDDKKQDGPVAAATAPSDIFTDESHDQDTLNALMQIDYDWRGHTLTSLTAFTSYDDFRSNIDVDFGPSALLMSPQTDEYDQFSQELRIASPLGGKFEYIVGIYYQSSNLDVFNRFTVAPFNGMGIVDHHQDEESIAAFGAITWNMTDSLSATLGLRWTDVKKEITRDFTITALDGSAATATTVGLFSAFLGFIPHPNTLDFDRSDDDVTPSISVQWDATPDMMLYGKYSQGFKAGGFDSHTRSAADPANFASFTQAINFGPESADAYEFGAKTYLLDGHMRANVAIFRSDYKGLQVATFDGAGGFLVGNAGKSRTQGVELEVLWAVTDQLDLNLSFSYLDAEYTKFETAQCRAVDPRPNPVALGACILSNEPLLYSPDFSGVLGFDYVYPVEKYQIGLSADLIFSDDYFVAGDNDPNTAQDGYTKIDAAISFGPESKKWELSIVGRNLSNKYTTTQGNDLPLGRGSYFFNLERTRSIAFLGRWNF